MARSRDERARGYRCSSTTSAESRATSPKRKDDQQQQHVARRRDGGGARDERRDGSRRRKRRRRYSSSSDGGGGGGGGGGDARSITRRRSPSNPYRRSGPLPSQSASFASTDPSAAAAAAAAAPLPPPAPKQRPNFAPTGLLAREANSVPTGNGTSSSSSSSRAIVLKYHEPPEARKAPPTQNWRLYRFAAGREEPADTIPLAERSCWLFGREAKVVDVLLEEPTASKQHAVVQFRYSSKRDEYGDRIESVRPYVIDLESKAGTSLNGKAVEAGRFVELRNGDGINFGESTEEWILVLPPEDMS